MPAGANLPRDGGESQFINNTKSTQDGVPRLFCLPQEIRQQIYENVITYAVNFIYKSLAQFREARQEQGIPRTNRRNRKLNEFRRAHGRCGITFDVAPFPKFINGSYDTINLLLVSKTFSSDIKSAASHIRLRIRTAVSRSLTGLSSYSQFWSTDPLTPHALDIIRSSRHIFAGYGHHTTATAAHIPPEVALNITNIFLTAFVSSYCYPGNWGATGRTLGRSTFSHRFKQFLEYFPNASILAFSCGPHGMSIHVQSHDHYILEHVTTVFDGRTSMKHNLKVLELVYRKEYHPQHRRSFVSKWITDRWEKYIRQSQGVKVPEQELECRGRYWSDYEHIHDEFRDILVEGTVWRISKEANTNKPPNPGLETASTPDFEQPFIDICPTEIFVGKTISENAEPQEPLMWEERCWGKACDCGHNCDIYTRRETLQPKSTACLTGCIID